ncbi:MAG TPA: cyclic nucleotide-binding domain-containing protein [Actinomycetota bacterium]|nr:cyclic nucleotide-binding domain-containing protein [Actinomycetota bacterium]
MVLRKVIRVRKRVITPPATIGDMDVALVDQARELLEGELVFFPPIECDASLGIGDTGSMECHFVPFVPGRRPTDEDKHPGLGSSDNAILITNDGLHNRAVLLFEVSGSRRPTSAYATATIDGRPLPGWERRRVELADSERQRLELLPQRDLAGIELGLATGLLRKMRVEIRLDDDNGSVATDETWLDVCDARSFGSLYKRMLDELLPLDTARQARKAGRDDPGVAYHPWYPVLKIGSDKAYLYNSALIADIVGKEHHLTDPAWLLRVGVYLELITCIAIFTAVRDDVGDLLRPDERAALEDGTYTDIRDRIDVAAWQHVWQMRGIVFPSFGSPRTGPVSALNLLRKREVTLQFLHVHHEDLKHAIELAGPNASNSQETWQRVFRDAERAVLRQASDAFPEIAFLPTAAREIVLWQRFGIGGQKGIYPTACSQYRSSMNAVAEWARTNRLMDYAGTECIPPETSLLEAHLKGDRRRLELLQRQDGLGPSMTAPEPVDAAEPTTEEIERLLASVAIFKMLSPEDVHSLALTARPLFLGPTQRLLIQGQEGTSLFLVGIGEVEVRLRKDDDTDWLVEKLGPGEVIGEMALLTGEKRAATVRSVDETVVYEIGREAYKAVVAAHPEWLDELAAIMRSRLERRRERISELEATPETESLLERIRSSFFASG